jgi:periplasmic copper chaperone A
VVHPLHGIAASARRLPARRRIGTADLDGGTIGAVSHRRTRLEVLPPRPSRRHHAPRALARGLLVLAVAALVLVGAAAPAAAHVDIEPTDAVAGSTVVVTFSFHHGKDGADTTSLEVQLPPGAEVVGTPTKEGWQVEVRDRDPQVVVWSGGRVPDGVKETFPLEVRLPSEPGEVRFPAVQVGDAGELAWIADEGGVSEADNPAPRIVLVEDPDAPATTTTEVPDATATTEAPTTTVSPGDVDDDLTVGVAAGGDDGDGGGLPAAAIALVVLALAAAVGGALWWRRRNGQPAA